MLLLGSSLPNVRLHVFCNNTLINGIVAKHEGSSLFLRYNRVFIKTLQPPVLSFTSVMSLGFLSPSFVTSECIYIDFFTYVSIAEGWGGAGEGLLTSTIVLFGCNFSAV